MRQESVILAISNDKYELPTMQFESTREMSKTLGISMKHCNSILSKQTVFRELNCRFIRVYLDEENSTKGGSDMSQNCKKGIVSKLLNSTKTEVEKFFKSISEEERESYVSALWNAYHKLSYKGA